MAHSNNSLLEMLPRKDREHLVGLCKEVNLGFNEILWTPGKPARYVYFPLTAFISMVASLDGEPVLEVGMAGHEGVLGAQLILGSNTAPVHAVVQGSGTALRLGAAAFQTAVEQSSPLRQVIGAYLSVLLSQTSTAAACIRFHRIGPRLARWLLMTQDRAIADTFEVTHQFMSYMLGVRRVGVTTAAGVLQTEGLIEYRRGRLTILDRDGLESAACSCYAADRKTYASALG